MAKGKGKRLVRNQKLVLTGLDAIANGLMILEDAEEAIKDMPVEQLREVFDLFEKTTTTFDVDELLDAAYKFNAQANHVVMMIVDRLGLEDVEETAGPEYGGVECTGHP